MSELVLADLLAGLDVVICGDPNVLINGVATIQHAKNGHITFLSNAKYKKYLNVTKASAVIIGGEYKDLCHTTAVLSTNPYFVYAKVAEHFLKDDSHNTGIHPSVVIGDNCVIADNVSIAPYAVIGDSVKIAAGTCIGAGVILGSNCYIGANTKIDARVTIYDDIHIGDQVEIASGTVIGSDGFGFANADNGSWYKVPQLGRVVIGNQVSIGANCSIDRGTIHDTIVRDGVKLDNLVQIGHNVTVGEHTIIAGCVGIAGSTSIGSHCCIGGATGISGHLTIVDRVIITGMTAVTKSILAPGVYSSGVGGVVLNKSWRRHSALVRQLDKVMMRLAALEAASTRS